MSARVVFLQLAGASGWQAVEQLNAVAGHGLEGDKHARPDSRRQVLLVEQEVLESFGLEPGALHEQITTAGLKLASLAAGAQLKVGRALLEVTKRCEPCLWVNRHGKGMMELLRGQRGMLATVVEGGSIRRGDEIRLCSST